MTAGMKTFLCGCLVVAATTAVYGAGAVDYTDFSRYDVILQRKPFGVPPPPPSEAPPPAPPKPVGPPAFIKALRLVAITYSKFGLKVGFLDITKKPPKSYYLRVGQSEDGIVVVDADYDQEGALLRKGDEEHWIYLKGESGGGPAAGAAGPGYHTAGGARPVTGDPAPGTQGYYARRKERRDEILEQRRRANEEREKLGSEELRQQLRTYNLELIRARGEKGPPLPIPLTEDEDDQLVNEGVLPPR